MVLGGPNIVHSAGSPDRQGGSQLLHLSFSESGFFFFFYRQLVNFYYVLGLVLLLQVNNYRIEHNTL